MTDANIPREVRAGDTIIVLELPLRRPRSSSDASWRCIQRHPGDFVGGLASPRVGGPVLFVRPGVFPGGAPNPEAYLFALPWNARADAVDLAGWGAVDLAFAHTATNLPPPPDGSLVAWARAAGREPRSTSARYRVDVLDAAEARAWTDQLRGALRALRDRAA